MELSDYRRELDGLDEELLRLFLRRMELVERLGEEKRMLGLPVLDVSREREKLDCVASLSPDRWKASSRELFSCLMRLSREAQSSARGKKRCGLLGERLQHSYSPRIHALLGDYSYDLLERSPQELETLLHSDSWDGLNVTIPYKKLVFPFCDTLSETALRIGSVNTLVRRPDGGIYGDNTDAYGFSLLLERSGFAPARKKALVLGSGGASAMVCTVLRQRGCAEVIVISRTGENHYGNLQRHADAELLVNTTPVGMYPNTGESPVDLTLFPRCGCVLDLVYNPARTALLQQAERLGIPCFGGLLMLVAQAKRSAELFTGSGIEDAEIDRIAALLSREMQNIILIGMPGSGKSEIARLLGRLLGRPVFDVDAEIEKAAGLSIPQIFEKEGEAGFRQRETTALRELGKRSGIVLATGGGCVTREENYPLLHQNGVIFWRKRQLSRLDKRDRPLSQSRDLNDLYAERAPLYARFADHVIEETETVEEAAEKILEVLQ
jgi:shikimate dehydrogenase